MCKHLGIGGWLVALLMIAPEIAWAQSSSSTNQPSESKSTIPTVIVVCPAQWRSALDEWIAYRASEYQAIVVESKPTPDALRTDILDQMARTAGPVAGIMLCGDVYPRMAPQMNGPQLKGPRPMLVPTFVVPTTVKLNEVMTPTLSTDSRFADIDSDGCPDVAIGRVPAHSPAELKRMLRRSIDYENGSDRVLQLSPSNWQNRIHVTAGIGGFGVLADSTIEAVTKKFLSEGIPDHYRLNTSYASLTSPYCPNPYLFRSTYIDRINQGGLFWVYIGHGNVHRLDDFQVGNELIPICDSQHVADFDIEQGPPIALLLACFTGAMDAAGDCFAERLLRLDHGPIAVIAGSRVTMPYGLSEFAGELMEGCFRERIPTLGEIVLRSKRSIWIADRPIAKGADGEPTVRERQRDAIATMAALLSPDGHDLTDERREHVRLMNLFGDPLLKIRYPEPFECVVPEFAAPGQVVDVQIDVPSNGRLLVELALTRDRLPEGVRGLREFTGASEQLEQMQASYAAANQLVLASSEQQVAPGTVSVPIAIPESARGKYAIQVQLLSDRQWFATSRRLTVRRGQRP